MEVYSYCLFFLNLVFHIYFEFRNVIGQASIDRLRAMLQKSYFFTFFVSLIIVVGLISFVQAAITSSFYVKPSEDVTQFLDLSADDQVSIKFSVVWGAEANTIGFSIVSPNGTVTDLGKQGTLNYSFTCTDKGEYILHFINNEAETKLVSLEYKIDHNVFGVFGLTPSLFWLVFIAVICILGIVVFVALSKTS